MAEDAQHSSLFALFYLSYRKGNPNLKLHGVSAVFKFNKSNIRISVNFYLSFKSLNITEFLKFPFSSFEAMHVNLTTNQIFPVNKFYGYDLILEY